MRVDGTTLELEIDEMAGLILEGALNVPRRISMLMAYGLNAVESQVDISHHLPGFMQFVDAPEFLTIDDQMRLQEDYRHWLVGSGFRDLIGGMEVFLVEFFSLLVRADIHQQGKPMKKADKLIAEFSEKGLSGQFRMLNENYCISTGYEKHFRSLALARNCLTHRYGIVGEKDIGRRESFKFSWLGFDAKFVESNGIEHLITPEVLGPFDSSKFSPGKLELTTTIVERKVSFMRGERLTIPPRSLQEICWMAGYTCTKLHQLILNWMLAQGVYVNKGKPLQDPSAQMTLIGGAPD